MFHLPGLVNTVHFMSPLVTCLAFEDSEGGAGASDGGVRMDDVVQAAP